MTKCKVCGQVFDKPAANGSAPGHSALGVMCKGSYK